MMWTGSAVTAVLSEEGGEVIRKGGVDVGLGKHGVDGVLEGASVLLAEPALAHRLALRGEEVGRDPRAAVGRHPEPPPALARLPLVVEPAALAEGRGQGDQPAAG